MNLTKEQWEAIVAISQVKPKTPLEAEMTIKVLKNLVKNIKNR